MKTGIELIAEERQEQIEKHGYTIKKDQGYINGQLISAAIFSLMPNNDLIKWPEHWSQKHKYIIKAKDRIGKLKVAGAFIAAEIDRLQSI